MTEKIVSLEKSGHGGNVKVTREDWLRVANDVLVSQGVEKVKVLTLGKRLDVSRSSFYWYFKSRKELLEELLKTWEQSNTALLIEYTQKPAETITEAVCNLFKCFIDPGLFNPQLDFAIREWARRSGPVRRVVDRSDEARLAAIGAMYERHGYSARDASARARILYYMQIGYYALELHEALDTRLSNAPGYLEGFTGVKPRKSEIDALVSYVSSIKPS